MYERSRFENAEYFWLSIPFIGFIKNYARVELRFITLSIPFIGFLGGWEV